MVLALNDVVDVTRHVVAEVVKAEFVVGSEGDVGQVSLATALRIGLVFVDAIDAQTMEFVQRAHPFGIAFSEVVVDGDDVNAFA